MTIRLDSTQISTVVWCDRCPYWHASTWTRAAGHAAAIAHEQSVHPGHYQAQNAASNFFRRRDGKV